MNPADLALIIQGIEAAIAAAPKVIAVAEKGKELITSLFQAGAISIEQQHATHSHVDAIMNAALAGETPPAWTVEADPGSPTPAPSNATPAASSTSATAPEASSGTFAPIPDDKQSAETVAEEKTALESPATDGGSPSPAGQSPS